MGLGIHTHTHTLNLEGRGGERCAREGPGGGSRIVAFALGWDREFADRFAMGFTVFE